MSGGSDGMWEKFTSSTKRAIKNAHDEAKRFHGDAVEPEYLLLGLLMDPYSFASKALVQMGVDVEDLKEAVASEMVTGEFEFDNLNFSVESKKVLEAAYKEARELKLTFIGSEHLLLGLLKVEGCKACRILNQHGVHYEAAREAVRWMIQS
jgi:ATP-dependent Clp protease ATP-binding subunit ClpC